MKRTTLIEVDAPESLMTHKFSVTVKIDTKLGWIDDVKILLNRYGNNIEKEEALQYQEIIEGFAIFKVSCQLEEIGIYYYCFVLKINGKEFFIKWNANERKAILTNEDYPYFKLEYGFLVPHWAKGGTIYHIFIDRFRKGDNVLFKPMPNRIVHYDWNETPNWKPVNGEVLNNDFFGGNLDGIKKSLDYLKKLGVNILYFSPILKSQSNHRYDTGDYEQIDPYVGTIEQFKQVCKVAHQNNMHVILDAVLNHSGNDSKYFNEYGNYDTIGAFQSSQSPYYNWYKKRQGQFDYWWGFKNLPQYDGECKELQKYLFEDIITLWIENWGADGLRFDVADELTEENLQRARKSAKKKKDIFLIGEVWKDAYKTGRTYVSSGQSLDSVMNYQWTEAVLKYVKYGDTSLKKSIIELIGKYPDSTIYSMMNALSTHDIPRAITTLGGDGFDSSGEWIWSINQPREWQSQQKLSSRQYKKAKELFKIAVFIIGLLPGNFSIFYGDEVGMEGYLDPFNRKPYPWDKRDKNLLQFFRQYNKVRNSMQINTAAIANIKIDTEYIMFERWAKRKYICVANRTDKPIQIDLPEGKVIYQQKKNGKKELAAYGAIIMEYEN